MKKARIMLSALAVLAVVGTALAFKAKDTKKIFCEDTQGRCLLQFTSITTVPTLVEKANPCVNDNQFYGTTTTTAPCTIPTVQFYSIVD